MSSWNALVKLRSLAALRCSGVLLDSSWVLTAASCFGGNYRHPNSYNIELHSNNDHGDNVPESNPLSTTPTTAPTTENSHQGQSIYVGSFYLHGRYSDGKILHNLALAHLHANVTSQSVPADVIGAHDNVNSVDCVTVGWGSNSTGEPVVPRVRQWSVLNSTLCSQFYNSTVNQGQLCAQLLDAQTGTCTGDIGAPLMCWKDGAWTATGIVTHTWRCHDNDQDPQPARFLSLQHYLPFVEKRGNFKDLISFG